MEERYQISLLFLLTLCLGALALLITLSLPFFTDLPVSEFGSDAGQYLDYLSGSLTQANAVALVTLVLALAVPFLLLFLYHSCGREKECRVPENRGEIPDRGMKPWLVHLVFAGEPLTFGRNGLYATILDLQRRGILEVRGKEDTPGLLIRMRKAGEGDPYEQRVAESLLSLGEGGVTDTDRIPLLSMTAFQGTGKERTMAINLLKLRENSMTPGKALFDKARGDYVESGRMKIVPIVLAGIVLLLATQYISFRAGRPGTLLMGILEILFLGIAILFILNPGGKSSPSPAGEGWKVGLGVLLLAMVTWLILLPPGSNLAALLPPVILLVQGFLALGMPATLFGTWKGDGYRKKKEWEALLRYFTVLRVRDGGHASSASLRDEWLVYGTALGVGDAVATWLERQNAMTPLLRTYRSLPAALEPVLRFPDKRTY